MDMKVFHAPGEDLSAGQQAAFYYARKRRRARELATAAEFKAQDQIGVTMVVILTVQ